MFCKYRLPRFSIGGSLNFNNPIWRDALFVYLLNEGSGKYLNDYCLSKRHSRAYGTQWYFDNTIQKVVLKFDGVDDYLNIPDSITTLDSNFALYLVIRAVSGTDEFGELVSANYGGDTSTYHFRTLILQDTTGNFQASVRNQTGSGIYDAVKTNNGFNDGKWHTVCFNRVYPNGVAGWEIWVDGVNETLTEYASVGVDTVPSLTVWNIGRIGGYPLRYFEGDIAFVAMFDRALTPNEIRYLHNMVKI